MQRHCLEVEERERERRLKKEIELRELCFKREIKQREADREIASARAEYEISEFTAKTKQLTDDVTTTSSSDNKNIVETVVPKTCSELTFDRSMPLLSDNLFASNTLSWGVDRSIVQVYWSGPGSSTCPVFHVY